MFVVVVVLVVRTYNVRCSLLLVNLWLFQESKGLLFYVLYSEFNAFLILFNYNFYF
jgi:hypothetical protein